jgi:replicative DNA helicase
MEQGLKLICVDYLQLMDSGRHFDNRVQEVSIISQSLKNLARELKIPVFAASQLSRAVESRGTKKPQLADLRESGSIEQDSDVVMFLYRPEEVKDMAPSPKIPTKLSIDKHRSGALAELDFIFNGPQMQFRPMTKREADEEK